MQLITQPLAEQTSAAELREPKGVSLNDDRQRRSRLVLWGFLLMFIGIALGVIGKKIMHHEIVTMIGVLVSVAGMFLTAYPYVTPAPRKRPDPGLSAQPKTMKQTDPARSLPAANNTDYLPSVTERTTALLSEPLPVRSKPGNEKM